MAKGFGDEVMVNQKIINAPEQQFAKGGIIQMRVDIPDRCRGDHLRYHGFQVGLLGERLIHSAPTLSIWSSGSPRKCLGAPAISETQKRHSSVNAWARRL